ncbi:MAG: c-type cytochrome [Burkholderiales bacterium]
MRGIFTWYVKWYVKLLQARATTRDYRHDPDFYGCASCDTVPGVDGADGNVGPPLTRIGPYYIAGVLRNTPENMIRFLREPQHVLPSGDMPDMQVTAQDARDITAYLYTLR